jgi:Na+-translocating ferredoxin:NAD+ oxidoreductase subunit B
MTRTAANLHVNPVILEGRETVMSDEVYHKLAKVLDTLPNGFPATKSGIEIKILKTIFTPEEAELFCDLRLAPETAGQIAQRTGRPLEGLEEKLVSMWRRGEISGVELGGVRIFKMIPWIVGIYEYQINRMDREFAAMCEEYSGYWGRQLLRHGPQIMQVIPIERKIPVRQEALTYQQVTNLIENAQAFAVNECICKKQRGLLDHPCSKPKDVCLALAPLPGVFDNHPWGGKSISREEAYEVLRKAEEAGLVHMTGNVQNGQHFICNCCGCCCGVLRAVKMMPQVVNSHYYAEIDPDKCSHCGICADERCQVEAIKDEGDFYSVLGARCIGCGLCATTCPEEAIELVHRKPEELTYPPENEEAWMDERARQRGARYDAFK